MTAEKMTGRKVKRANTVPPCKLLEMLFEGSLWEGAPPKAVREKGNKSNRFKKLPQAPSVSLGCSSLDTSLPEGGPAD